MEINTLSPDFSVSPQITPEDLEQIRAKGFKSVICNRPDHESADQPTYDAIRAAAEAQDLKIAFVPVVSGAMTAQDVTDFGAALETLPSPVLAYCRSGTRSGILWQNWMAAHTQ